MRGGQSLLHGVAESHVHPHTSADRGDGRPITGASAQSTGGKESPRRDLGARPLLWPDAQSSLQCSPFTASAAALCENWAAPREEA